jgi:MscS family membrane protein
MIGWNPIHLIDGEAGWFLTFLTVISAAAVATHFLRWLFGKLHVKFQEKAQPLKNAAIAALETPLTSYIWFLSFLKCFDLVTDTLFSESFSKEITVILKISIVIFFSWFLIRLKRNIMEVMLKKSLAKEIGVQPGKIHVFGKLISAIFTVIVLLLCMEVTGVSMSTLVAFGGLSGLGIAFASQEIIANFFSGIMVHVVEPFAVGESISLPSSSISGKVEEIGWYETRLSSPDKQPIYIPNALFSKAYVVNSTRRTHRIILEKLSLRHEDLPRVKPILVDIRSYLMNEPSIDSTEKLFVNIETIGSYSVDISIQALSFFIDEKKFLLFRDEVLLKVLSIIKLHGAEIAIPVELILSHEKTAFHGE